MVFLVLQTQKLGFISRKHLETKKILYKLLYHQVLMKLKSLNFDIKRINVDKGYYTESYYPFSRKSIFSTLGSIIEISPQGPIIGFVFDDSIRNLQGFDGTIIYKEYNLSPNPVDIRSFDNSFLECDIAEGIISKGKRSGITHNWTMTVGPGYKTTEKISGGITWYKTATKDVISGNSFKIKN